MIDKFKKSTVVEQLCMLSNIRQTIMMVNSLHIFEGTFLNNLEELVLIENEMKKILGINLGF